MKLMTIALAGLLLAKAQDPPPAPGTVNANTGTQDGTINVSWSTAPQVNGYNVYRAPVSGGSFVKINGSNPVTATSYTDTGLNGGTRYFYVIHSVRNGPPLVEGPASSEANAVAAGTDTTAPATPVITSPTRKTRDATPQVSGTGEPSTSITVLSGETVVGNTTVGLNGTWTVSGTSSLGGEGVYQIRARAVDNATNESGLSTPIQITLDLTPPAAPTEVRTTSFNNCVDIEWTASVSSDVAGYKVERRVGTGSWTLLNTNLVVGTKYRDATAQNGTTYTYRVIAVDDALNN